MTRQERHTLESIESSVSARDFFPRRLTLASLREAAGGCRGCPLWQRGTQTVFGEGLRRARLVLVGEQPGDREDRQGRPFVGGAGRVLDQGLRDAGIARDDAYVTNVVKHFKWTAQGKRRIHKKPSAREVRACLPWLEQELELIRPRVLVCLGATAAQALLGSAFRVTRQRGQLIAGSPWAPQVLATLHPAAVLRMRSDEERRAAQEQLVADLRVVAHALAAA